MDDDSHDNYEDEYRSALREVNRLRGIAREYGVFYDKVKESLEKKDWTAIETAIAWSDE